jgi:hypothetical protein
MVEIVKTNVVAYGIEDVRKKRKHQVIIAS